MKCPVRALGLAAALATMGCGAERTGAATQAILGGQLAPDDHNVVAVVNFAGGQCSGSLIAPRLVLTARHCVADTFDGDAPVICGRTAFEDPDSAGAVFVVARPEITDDPNDYRALDAILLPEGVDADLCGTDVVLLVLKEPLTGVEPLEPRLDPKVAGGEPYSAVGFGVDEEVTDGPHSGVRKRLDGLRVSCSGGDCGAGDIHDNEWVGSGGPCPGDSGGPALDRDGRVIGVVSRGTSGCGDPVFGDVASRADWLEAQAVRLANEDAVLPPAWAPCDDPEPCLADVPEEPATEEQKLESSCRLAPGPAPRAPSALAALLAALSFLGRRRFAPRRKFLALFGV